MGLMPRPLFSMADLMAEMIEESKGLISNCVGLGHADAREGLEVGEAAVGLYLEELDQGGRGAGRCGRLGVPA
jgi:hypothetical protein